jgi:hypothetical protein
MARPRSCPDKRADGFDISILKLHFLGHPLGDTQESDFAGLTAILGQLSGYLDEGYLSEFKVGVVFVSESKILSA